MASKKIQDYISEWMDSFGKENGYELSRCEFVKEGASWFLRVYVDKLINGQYDYMSSDDCEIVSRYLSAKLDEEDPISQNYYLEVSSPGLDRLLVSEKDYHRFTGEIVEIKLYEPINGSRKLEGAIKDYKDGTLFINLEDNSVLEINEKNLAKVNLKVII